MLHNITGESCFISCLHLHHDDPSEVLSNFISQYPSATLASSIYNHHFHCGLPVHICSSNGENLVIHALTMSDSKDIAFLDAIIKSWPNNLYLSECCMNE